MAITLKSIGYKGERHGKHGCPGTSNEHERKHKHILVANERHHGKAYTADNKTEGVSQLGVLELRQSHCPQYRAYCLPAEQHANPVAGSLIALRGSVGGMPYGVGDGAVGVGPHIHKGSPAEELNQAHLPEHRRRMLKQLYPRSLLLLLLRLSLVVFGILLGVPLLNLARGV